MKVRNIFKSAQLSGAVMLVISSAGVVCSEANAATITALTPFTVSGSVLSKVDIAGANLVYMAPSVDADIPTLCSMAFSRMGEGKVLLLDVSESAATSEQVFKTKGQSLQSCVLGSAIPGKYFLVKLEHNTKKINALDANVSPSAAELKKQIATWK